MDRKMQETHCSSSSVTTILSTIEHKQLTMRQRIRQQQIHRQRNIIRYEMLLNYSSPQHTVRALHHNMFLLSLDDDRAEQKLADVLGFATRLLGNYACCEMLAGSRIFEELFLLVVQVGTPDLLALWMRLLGEAMGGWALLWGELVKHFTEIIDPMLQDMSEDGEVVHALCDCIVLIKQKYQHQFCMKAQTMVEMLQKRSLSSQCFQLIIDCVNSEIQLNSISKTRATCLSYCST